MFVQIQTGSYVARTTLDSLSGWASQLTKIYNVKVCGAVERYFSLDWGMLELVFYDAYTNAQKYGHQEKEPWVELEIRESDSVLALRVCNVADPAAPEITDDMAKRILQGGKGACYASTRGPASTSICTSDGIGMLNALKSVKSFGGEMKFYQTTLSVGGELNERVTRLEIVVPFEKSSSPSRTCSIHNINAEPVNKDKSQEHRSAEREVDAEGPRCISVDDQLPMLKLYDRMLHQKFLRSSRSATIGARQGDIENAVDIIMGRKTEALEICDEVMPFHIVTLDYHVGHRLKGTDIARQLNEEGFMGVVCLLSGGSVDELSSYLQLPGIDMVAGKEEKLAILARRLISKWGEKKNSFINV
jgi:hypothetical protein